MLVDLISTTTSDGIQLEGALFQPAPGEALLSPESIAIGPQLSCYLGNR